MDRETYLAKPIFDLRQLYMHIKTQHLAVTLLGNLLQEEFPLSGTFLYSLYCARQLIEENRTLDAGYQLIVAMSELFTLSQKNKRDIYKIYSSPKYLYLINLNYPITIPILQEFFNTLYINHIALQQSTLLIAPTVHELEAWLKE